MYRQLSPVRDIVAGLVALGGGELTGAEQEWAVHHLLDSPFHRRHVLDLDYHRHATGAVPLALPAPTWRAGVGVLAGWMGPHAAPPLSPRRLHVWEAWTVRCAVQGIGPSPGRVGMGLLTSLSDNALPTPSRRLVTALAKAGEACGTGLSDALAAAFERWQAAPPQADGLAPGWCQKLWTYGPATPGTPAADAREPPPAQQRSHEGTACMTLRLSHDMLSGSTGCHEWEAGFWLAEFVLNNADLFQGE